MELVNQMGFGALSHLPDKNLNQQLLKQIYDRYDIHDNTIYSDEGSVKLTTKKIGHALGHASMFQRPSQLYLTWRPLLKGIGRYTSKTSCVYVLMIIYFHETHFGEDSKEDEAQPPWIRYWTGDKLKKRIRQEKRHEAGLLKIGEMKAKKDNLKNNKPTMREPSSRKDSDAESSSSSDSESSSSSNSDPEPEPEHDSESEGETDQEVYEEPPPQREIRSKWKNDHPVVASNAPVHTTQQSVAGPGSLASDDDKFVDFLRRNKRRKSQRIANMHKKQRLDHINEGDGATRFPSKTRMFYTFDTVNLGRDDSDHVVVEGSVVAPTQQSQPEKE
ncbi:hypothetical protein PIB30_014841 [Stylosanthes scabra]|uniref:Uncharacterized protein n=1 Tax=Stylosanthes scabra TaxID=79078 RepID=A0ABU6R754_9FABA|nr:hypothetical protein [Stylosanthes scabra]